MSSTAPQLRNRLPRIASRFDQLAAQRARLAVVPRVRSRAPKVPFITLVSAVLLTGVIGLLLFNTSMQQASFRATALEAQARDLGARQEALELQVQELRNPDRIAREAQGMDMVIPTTPAGVLDLGTGEIIGDPEPATAEGRLPLSVPPPERPADLDPAPVVVDTPTGSQGNGAPDRDRPDDRPKLGNGRDTARR